MKIKYDTPIEVTKSQYNRLMTECDGVVAGQEKDGKFFIKVWLMKYKQMVLDILK